MLSSVPGPRARLEWDWRGRGLSYGNTDIGREWGLWASVVKWSPRVLVQVTSLPGSVPVLRGPQREEGLCCSRWLWVRQCPALLLPDWAPTSDREDKVFWTLLPSPQPPLFPVADITGFCLPVIFLILCLRILLINLKEDKTNTPPPKKKDFIFLCHR